MRNLESDQITEIVECMHPIDVARNCLIIRENDVGSLMYVVEEGRVEVTKDSKYLCTLREGKIFGELAILYNCTRTASVRALDTCRLWAINRQCFQAIMMKTGLAKQEEYAKFLTSVPCFNALPQHSIQRIADLLDEEQYSQGEYILRQGAPGDTFYIISKGEVTITQSANFQDARAHEKVITTCGVGDYFGERALQSEDVRTANVIASSIDGVTCLTLDRMAFTQLLSYLEELLKQDQEHERTHTSSQDEFVDLRLNNLEVLSTLGVGGFGRVELVCINNDQTQSFALKQLKKSHVVETKQQVHVMNERNIMLECRSDFIVRLYKTFRDRKYLYMLMEVCLGGELWSVLRDKGHFDEATARFYCACVLEAFEYLHNRGIIYRDLKPENLILDHTGYIKLVDFGFAKQVGLARKTWTFCGTPEYVAPEIVLNKGHDSAADIWTMGILLYELLTGSPPFTATDPMKTYNLILKGVDALDFPRKMTKGVSTLIKKLCRDLPAERLGVGNGGIKEIRKHKFFLQSFNFQGLRQRKLAAPILPQVQGSTDSSNFDNFPPDEDNEPPDDDTGWDESF